MANKLLGMKKVRQILLFLKQAVSQRSIEKEVKINKERLLFTAKSLRKVG